MRGTAVTLVVLVGCVGSGAEPVADGDELVLQRSADSCKIDQTTYAAGAVNPANPCQLCEPTLAKKAWSSAPDGSWCDDGNACTGTDSCTAGTCSPGPVTSCDDSDECTADSCDPSSGCVSVVDEACIAAADLSVWGIEATPRSPAPGATVEVVVPLANEGVLDAEGVELFVTVGNGLSIDPGSVHFETAGWSTGTFMVVTHAGGGTTLYFDQIVVSPNPPGLIQAGVAGRLGLTVQVRDDASLSPSQSVSANVTTTTRERVTSNNSDGVVLTITAP